MWMTSETLRLLITGDSDGAVQAFKKARDSADRDLGKAQDEAEKTSARLTKMGAASLAAGAVMVGALASTIKPASDLNEAINVVGLTFGDSADEIVEWGKSAASSTGLAASAALSGAAAIGGLLNNVGFLQEESTALSQDLVTLAADMGSAFNMSTVDALEAIRSGLAGEAEPLKRFNVFLSEAAVNAKAMELGLSDGTAALSEHEKAQARLAIIMEQTSAIQGDFAATADGAANGAKVAAAEFENMKATIGTELLPIVTEVLGAMNGLLGAFNDLPGPIKSVIGQAALLTTGLLLVGGAALTVGGRVKDLRATLSGFSAGTKTAIGASAALTLVVWKAYEAWDEYNKTTQESEDRIRSMTDAIRESEGVGDPTVQWLRSFAEENENVRKILGGLTQNEMREWARSIESGAQVGDDLAKRMMGLAGFEEAQTLLHDLPRDFAAAQSAAEDFNNIDQSGAMAMYETYGRMRTNAHRAAEASESLGGSINRMEPPAKTLADAIGDVNSELATFFGSVQSAEEAEADFQEALDDASDSIEENGKRIGTNTERQRANLRARGRVIESIENTVRTMIDEGASADEVAGKTRNMIQAYEDTLVAAGLSRDQAREYASALDEIPEQVLTTLEQQGYDDAYWKAQELRKMYESMERVFTATVRTETSGSSGGGSSSGGDSRPIDLPPLGPQPRRARSFDMGEGNKNATQPSGTPISVVVELDGRTIAKSMERVSERDGGLRIKTRAGG